MKACLSSVVAGTAGMCLRWGVLGPLVVGRNGAVASPRDFHCDGGAPWNVDGADRLDHPATSWWGRAGGTGGVW